MKPIKFDTSTKTFCKELSRNLLGEFLGTFTIVAFIIGGSAQNILSNHTVGEFIVGPLATGFGVMMGIRLSIEASGAHLNPCVTTAMASIGRFPWKKVPFYILVQTLAAFIAAAVTYGIYFDALQSYAGGGSNFTTLETAAIFTSFPSSYISLENAFLDSAFTAACLTLPMIAIGDTRNWGVPTKYSPIFYGLLVTAFVNAFAINVMCANNPAKDFGPRVFLALAGWGSKVFNGPNFVWWWVPLVAPHVGGIVGAFLYMFLIAIHHDVGCAKTNNSPQIEVDVATTTLDADDVQEHTRVNSKMHATSNSNGIGCHNNTEVELAG